jgi:asparagine synthase (glutamine-hydrolysing)
MSGLCGWINFREPNRHSPDVLQSMLAPIAWPNAAETATTQTADGAFAAAHWQKPPALHKDGADAAVVIGTPYFSDPELQRKAQQLGLATAILEAYRQRGTDMLRHINGRFALAVSIQAGSKAIIAVDRLASHPLVYQYRNHCLIFGSKNAAITAHPEGDRTIEPQAIFDYLYMHHIPAPETIYRGQKILLPGQYAELHLDQLNVQHYWMLQYRDETKSASVADYQEEFRDILWKGIERELDGQSVGAFLSGGTDSSTVSGVLGKVSGQPARTFSIGFDAQGYDEMEYARITARHFQTEHTEYYCTPSDIVAIIPQLAQYYSQPFGNSSAVPAYYCALKAREKGITKMLAGDGGDELFAGNTRYVKQQIFELYYSIPAALRNSLVEPLLDKSWADGFFLTRKARSYIQQARIPMPDRMETYNLLDRLGINEIFHPNFLVAVNTHHPLETIRKVYHDATAKTMLNRMLAMDYKFTLADNDLVKVNGTCDLAGMNIAYPLLTDEIVAFAARVPTTLKIKRFRLRHFFKEALKDFLPPAVITKKKHGFGLPIGPWLISHAPLTEIAREALDDLVKRQIIQRKFADTLFGEYLPQQPGYYGPMVWILLMLQKWYQYHAR